MNCAECGERLVEGARFCSACGRKVETELRKPPPVPMPRPPESRAPVAAPKPQAEVRVPIVAPKPRRPPLVPPRLQPIGMVALGVLLGMGALWSAHVDDAASKAEAARRMTAATQARETTTQETAPESTTFSTRQALQGLYGAYDPHLDGVFWTVNGAPREWAEWNGKPVLIKPLVSRSDESGTRHVLVTNSVEIRDGLVVKQGAGCSACKSLLGAALFERRGEQWVLVKEHRFMRIDGAWGAPPKVDVDFPRKGGVEVRIESASADNPKSKTTQAVVLHGGNPGALAARSAPAENTDAQPAQPPGDANARALVAAALKGNHSQVRAIASQLRKEQPQRGNRTLARNLNERGLALVRQGSYAEAASLFRHAYDADRGDAEIRENLGYALLKSGRLSEAETALTSALEIAPDRPSAWGSLGHVYAKQGKRDQAVAMLRTAHRVAPDPKQVLETYARQAETEDDPKIRAMLADAVVRLSSAQ